jgi:tetratricopeptide (TPR) repeat protein
VYHGALASSAIPSTVGLVGREADLRRLAALFDGEPAAAHVALYGLPGVGKTALATAYAQSQLASAAFPDGVLWAGLGRTPDTLSLLSGWGAALGMPAADLACHQSAQSLGKAVRAAIGQRRLLLVIDDAWALEDALALQVGGANCGRLVTTRFPTVAWQFAPTGTRALGELDVDDSVSLLASLAPAAVAAEPVEARELAQSVGGLPLALTLMGSYLHTQAQSGQPRRLRAALSLLRHMGRRMELARPYAPVDAPAGMPSGAQQSLQAALALSEAALSGEARTLWRALACLPAKPSSFAEDAALAVGAQPVATLDELSDAGLLESVGPGRYTLHQTVHDYARYLGAPPDAERRMAHFYVTYAEANALNSTRLEPDAENIVVALQLADRLAEPSLVACGGVAFAPFLEARGLLDQAEAYLANAQTAGEALGDAQAQAGALLGLARIANRRGLVAEAERLYAQGLALAESTGETRLTYALLIGWGEAAMGSGDFVRAEAYLRRGLTLARGAGDLRRTGETLRLLGEVADAAGYFTQGDTLYYEGLALARQSDDTETICTLLQNIGGKAVLRNDYATGARLLQEGLALACANGHRQRVSALLNNLGVSAQRQGQPQEAERLFSESLALARMIGQPKRIITALENLAWLASEGADFAQATAYAEECLAMARDVEQPLLIGDCLCLSGELRLRQSRATWYDDGEAPSRVALLAEGAACFEAARQIGKAVNGHNILAQAMYGLARIAAAQGRLAEAQRLGAECLTHITAESRAYSGEITDWLATLDATFHSSLAAGAPVGAAHYRATHYALPAFRAPNHPAPSQVV